MPYKDPIKQKEAHRKYYLKNKKVHLARTKIWRIKNQERAKEIARNYYLKHKKLISERYQKNKNFYNRNDKQRYLNLRKQFPWICSYNGAKSRCQNPKDKAYKWYGARGIKFRLTKNECDRLWKKNRAWLLSRPSLHRKNSKKDYCYDNCKFIELSLNSKISALEKQKLFNKLLRLYKKDLI